jgi:predicted alpha/beta superfamily hydrolase
MGGLISLYAISEYPDIFGGAICMSTHWPIANGVTVGYVKDHLPSPQSHKLYFDYGTKTLDAQYEQYQTIVDDMIKQAGYEYGKNWVTRKFPGADHSERSWRKRVHIPLTLMLGD